MDRGRPRKELDTEILYDLTARGVSQKDIAGELGVSIPTLSSRIADIQSKQGLILQYRALQNLQLTELQARCLEAITPEKIEAAPLRDLIFSYKVLKDKELTDIGKPTDIKGIMHYLIQIEKEEQAAATPVDIEDGEFSEEATEYEPVKEDLSNYIPNL
jgi:transcriptional regulator with XRE-family HTH domain